jgi:hypothetical protein
MGFTAYARRPQHSTKPRLATNQHVWEARSFLDAEPFGDSDGLIAALSFQRRLDEFWKFDSAATRARGCLPYARRP